MIENVTESSKTAVWHLHYILRMIKSFWVKFLV